MTRQKTKRVRDHLTLVAPHPEVSALALYCYPFLWPHDAEWVASQCSIPIQKVGGDVFVDGQLLFIRLPERLSPRSVGMLRLFTHDRELVRIPQVA
ncbi:MAG TPA: hypothetical protein VF808_11895 [Ktedonobacterales bacterium]